MSRSCCITDKDKFIMEKSKKNSQKQKNFYHMDESVNLVLNATPWPTPICSPCPFTDFFPHYFLPLFPVYDTKTRRPVWLGVALLPLLKQFLFRCFFISWYQLPFRFSNLKSLQNVFFSMSSQSFVLMFFDNNRMPISPVRF